MITFPVELPANTSAEQVEQWLSASGFTKVQAEREIDAPAHTLAFYHYHPELGSAQYGKDHLDLHNPKTYEFQTFQSQGITGQRIFTT